MSTAPIDIPRRPTSPSSSIASSSSGGRMGLYVPVHKRTPSVGTSISTISMSHYGSSRTSSRSTSPSPSILNTHTSTLPIYSPAALLNLAASPLAVLAPETRTELRAHAPEVVLNRKQRKAQVWHRSQQERGRTEQRSSVERRSPHKDVESWRGRMVVV